MLNSIRWTFLVLTALRLAAVPRVSAQAVDSLDPRAYFPLQVGNEWEFQHDLYRPRTAFRPKDESERRLERYRIIDQLVQIDIIRFVLVYDEWTEERALIRRDTSLVWYDDASASVVGDNLPFILHWLQCLDAPLGRPSPAACDSWPFVSQDTLFLPHLSEKMMVVKTFASYVWSYSVAHGLGIVNGGGGCEPCGPFDDTDTWTLEYARVDDHVYGAQVVRAERPEAPPGVLLVVYPHPVQGEAVIEVPGHGWLEVFDILGRRVHRARVHGSGVLDTRAYPPGLYVLRFEDRVRTMLVQ